MKRILSTAVFCLAVGLLAAACDDDNGNPGEPSGLPATITFRATLAASNEVPPVTNAEAGATGVMDITLNLTRDNIGVITAASVNFNGSVANFPAGSAVTIAHIHPGAAGANGGILVNTGLVPGEVTLVNGGASIVKNGITIGADVATQIINNPAGFYFNVHSALNPPGAVRGQLVRTD
jgi:hypothetical protein